MGYCLTQSHMTKGYRYKITDYATAAKNKCCESSTTYTSTTGDYSYTGSTSGKQVVTYKDFNITASSWKLNNVNIYIGTSAPYGEIRFINYNNFIGMYLCTSSYQSGSLSSYWSGVYNNRVFYPRSIEMAGFTVSNKLASSFGHFNGSTSQDLGVQGSAGDYVRIGEIRQNSRLCTLSCSSASLDTNYYLNFGIGLHNNSNSWTNLYFRSTTSGSGTVKGPYVMYATLILKYNQSNGLQLGVYDDNEFSPNFINLKTVYNGTELTETISGGVATISGNIYVELFCCTQGSGGGLT